MEVKVAASDTLRESTLERRRKKSVADRKLNRATHSSKMKKTAGFTPDLRGSDDRRRQPVMIIHSVPPPEIWTEPSNFMGVVQMLTGDPRTRSRWENRPNLSISIARSEITSNDACKVARTISCNESESRSFRKCSDEEEESVSVKFFNGLSESVCGPSTSPTVTTESLKSDSNDAEDSSSRGQLSSPDSFYSGFLAGEIVTPSLFDSYPGMPEPVEHFATPVWEPIPDSTMLPFPSFRDVDPFTFLNDMPLSP